MRGAPELSLGFLVNNNSAGGIGPAIQGTLILIGFTSLFGIPIGILSGIYLANLGTTNTHPYGQSTMSSQSFLQSWLESPLTA